MAVTAVFDAENQLINTYESGKAAKAAHKGQTDVIFVTEKNFPEGGIGEYAVVTDLFPAKEKAKKSGNKRTIAPLEGDYVVVNANGARLPDGDPRAAFVTAMVNNSSFAGYFEDAPEKVEYTNARGKEKVDTASQYIRYALKRKWISLAAAE